MNFQKYISRILNESYETTLDLGNEIVEVFKNPDSYELEQCMGKQYKDARGLVMADTGDLFTWTTSLHDDTPGSIVAHGPVIKKMKWESRPFIPIVLDQVKGEVYISTWEISQSSVQRKMSIPEINEYLAKNPHVKSLGMDVQTTKTKKNLTATLA